ncbi:LysR substrate-binding domain-containing protein [Klebsiella pneumoniae subsp. pneumoniae]|nr:LysR substrate-binding domain-containing protein [Klebsiella pneumoniae subsp. pneumoniae]
MPELVTDFYQQNSNLVMTLTTEHTETLVKKLDLREIDLALTLQPVQQGEILTTLIAEVPLVYIDRHYRQGRWRSTRSTSSAGSRRGPHSLSAAIATRRDFSTTRLNVQTYYMATEFVKRGMGCSITDIFPPSTTWPRR